MGRRLSFGLGGGGWWWFGSLCGLCCSVVYVLALCSPLFPPFPLPLLPMMFHPVWTPDGGLLPHHTWQGLLGLTFFGLDQVVACLWVALCVCAQTMSLSGFLGWFVWCYLYLGSLGSWVISGLYFA